MPGEVMPRSSPVTGSTSGALSGVSTAKGQTTPRASADSNTYCLPETPTRQVDYTQLANRIDYRFLKSMPERIESLRKKPGSADVTTAYRYAYSITGAASNFR